MTESSTGPVVGSLTRSPSEPASELPARIRALISARTRRTLDSVRVTDIRPLAGGACQDNVRVVIELGAEPAGDQASERLTLVLRGDAAGSLPGSLARRDEFAIISAAVARGVRTPAVYWPSEDLLGPGCSSYFMDWLPGETIAHKVLRAPELAGARAGLLTELCEQLACIHGIEPATVAAGEPGIASSVARAIGDGAADPIDAALGIHRRALDRLPEAYPAIELALRFLDEGRPRLGPRVLCHGDFRTGNLAVTRTGLSGVLDWEFAHWGDAMDDLGWACVRDWRFGALDKPAFGLAARADFYAAYEAARGVPVDPDAVRYWELMGNVRWAIGALYQGQRYRSGSERDLELIAIGKRALEIRYEIVRQLDSWPT